MISLPYFDTSKHVFLSSLFFFGVLGAALQNITLPLPVGTSNHGTPGLLCTPTKWTDLASFYLFNYVAHAATVLTRPGERPIDFAVTVVGSLLFPAMGLYRGIEAILSGALLGGGDLRKAARSGALCMLVRSPEWRPVDEEGVCNTAIKRSDVLIESSGQRYSTNNGSVHLIAYQAPWTFSKFGRPVYVHRQIIHGTHTLPDGYRFIVIPPDTQLTIPLASQTTIEVASTYNLVRALIALVQTGYASVTLYRSRGDQIERFGYAAFGLTVAPYAVMSIVNLIGSLCRPDYTSLYMVESSIMDEARKRGGVFNGTVSRVEEESLPSVCSCTSADAKDIKHLRFSTDDSGNLTAAFGTVAPLKDIPHAIKKSEKRTSECSSTIDHSYRVEPIPPRMDYTGTEKSTLIFIPSANPLRSSVPSIENQKARYQISSITLKKTSWLRIWTCKHHHWSLSFEQHTYNTLHPLRWRFAKYFLTELISLIPVIVNGTMSHFHSGSVPATESSTWKSYTMQWLVFGLVTGIWWVLDQEGKDASPSPKKYLGPVGRVLLYVLSASPAVGGFIVVGQMVVEYGVCFWVGS